MDVGKCELQLTVKITYYKVSWIRKVSPAMKITKLTFRYLSNSSPINYKKYLSQYNHDIVMKEISFQIKSVIFTSK